MQLEFPLGTPQGYECNPSSQRERDAASPAILPAFYQNAPIILPEAAAVSTARAFKFSGLYVTPPVNDYTRDSERGHAEGVPKASRRNVSFPQGTRVTYVTLRQFLLLLLFIYYFLILSLTLFFFKSSSQLHDRIQNSHCMSLYCIDVKFNIHLNIFT